LWLAEACGMAGRWTDGEHALLGGILLEPDGPCVPALARLYLSWAQALAFKSGTASQSEQDALRHKAISVLEDLAAPSADSQLLLAEIAWSAGDAAKAETVLRRIAPENIPARLRLARVLRIGNRKEESAAEAELALHDCLAALRDSPDDLTLLVRAADAAELLRDYDQAIELLRKQAASGRHPALAESVALLHLTKWEAHCGTPGSHQNAEDLDLLFRAFEWAPWNASVVRRLWSIAREETLAGQAADDFLAARLAAGDVPAVGHMVLGSAAAQTGDFATARAHLELAYRQGPKLVAVANNLAWTLAHCDPPDLPRALEIVDDLLASEKNVDVLHTRGQIYLKQARWRDAIGDLERVLPFRPRDAGLHRALALAFGKLELPKLALRHAQQAAELTPDVESPDKNSAQ
jgi:tetratricopeptide (TPR) repeat protein